MTRSGFNTPLRFIFSHSALKEGRDNPNVFQVCTLLEQSSALSARQKIGRGLRLCVNQEGERLYDRQVNCLHVIASEHFAEFADSLQKEIEHETGVKFGSLDIASFMDIEVPISVAVELGIGIPSEAMETTATPASAFDLGLTDEPTLPVFTPAPKPVPTVKLGHDGAQVVIETLQNQGVLDKREKITSKGSETISQGKLLLPQAYQPIADPIIEEIRRANTKMEVRDASKEIVVRRKKEVFLTPEFQAIWERIRQKTLYASRWIGSVHTACDRKAVAYAADSARSYRGVKRLCGCAKVRRDRHGDKRPRRGHRTGAFALAGHTDHPA